VTYPLTGWPSDQIHALLSDAVGCLAEDPTIAEFYIGRTVDLKASLYRHGADCISSLYESDGSRNTRAVESRIIDDWFWHPKCSNDAADSRGGSSADFRCAVYVAWWYVST